MNDEAAGSNMRDALQWIADHDTYWTSGIYEVNGVEVLERSSVGNIRVRGQYGKRALAALASADPPQGVGAGIPPSLPKGWSQEHAAKAAWMINTLAVTPPDEWRTKAELHETLAEFRALSVTRPERRR